MKSFFPHIEINLLSLFLLLLSVFADPVAADSVIRIIGDSTTKTPDNSIGSKSRSLTPPPSVKKITPIRIIGDKQKNAAEQQSVNEAAEPEPKAKTVEMESLPKETTEQQLARSQATLKAEEERKAAEKVEQERLAQVKFKQENDAALQEAIKKEQEQLTARKAEELRKALEDKEKYAAEAGRLAAIIQEQNLLSTRKAEELRKATDQAEKARSAELKADEERLSAARRALTEKLLPKMDSTPQKVGSGNSPVDPPSTTVNRYDPGVNTETATGSDTAQAPATIWDLYLSAKANDPALGRTEARVTGSKADSDLLFSGLLPHLNTSAGIKQISQTLSNYNTNDSSYDYTAFNYNMSASLTLLNVPTLYALSAAAAGLSGEQAGVAAARQNLIVKLTDSYFALLKAQTDKQIALGEINRLKQVLDQSQAFLKAGTGDIISVYEAQSRLDSAGADLTKSESNLRLAEQKLSRQVGKAVTVVVNYLPTQPAGPDPDNIDWWVATMEKEQPVVRQAREGLVQTAEQRKAVKAEYLPVLQASGGYDVNRGTAALPTAEVRQWFVGASLSLPLYSGGETSAKVRRAVASEEERRHVFDETMDQHSENVKQAFFNLRYNISLIKALDQRKTSAEIQLAAVKKGRKIGTRNAIDVLNAEQTYSMALRDYRYALYDNIIRVIQLKSAAGILAENDISALSAFEAPTPGSGLNLIISQASR